jgi:hypothetical protein
MLENRSFDNLLGFLYDADDMPPHDLAFDGLTGDEFQPRLEDHPPPFT